MKFLLIHQYSGNKGDRAVLYAMCRLLKSKYPDSEITVSTSDAKLWDGYEYYKNERIHFVPWAWDYNNVSGNRLYWKFLRSIKKYTFTIMREAFLRGLDLSRIFSNPGFNNALRNSDVVISVGGHHFTTMLSRDLVSGINFDAMTTTSHKPLICFAQSFGPFKFYNDRNRRLTQTILSRSQLMPREQKSKDELIGLIGTTNNITLTYESVISLSKQVKYNPIEKRENCVGIAIYCTQNRTNDEKEGYQNAIAGFCDNVISKGYSVRFFPMEIKGSGPDDRKFIQEIISKVTSPEHCTLYVEDMETLKHLEEVSKCRVFLGHKTHSTIFALATGTPLIAIAYHPKTIEFMRQYNLDDNVMSDEVLDSERLNDIFERVEKDLDAISVKEYNRSCEIADQIERDLGNAISKVTQ